MPYYLVKCYIYIVKEKGDFNEKIHIYIFIILPLFLSFAGCGEDAATMQSSNNTENQAYQNSGIKGFDPGNFGYKFFAEGNQNLLNVYVNDTENPVQTIEYETAPDITENEYYLEDINFDGTDELILPAERPASGIYFNAYFWNDETGQFELIPDFRNLANPAIDNEERVILSHKTSSQITSYGKTSFKGKETENFSSIYWESVSLSPDTPDENTGGFYVCENIDGKEKKLYVPSDPNSSTEPDWNCKELIGYTQEGSYWDIDSDKWKTYFFEY